jgi:hypothetical protein
MVGQDYQQMMMLGILKDWNKRFGIAKRRMAWPAMRR